MRTIDRTNQFKRDLKRELAGRYKNVLTTDFITIVERLAADQPLPQKCFDHALTRNWSDHRHCHVKPDLILINRIPDAKTLQLVSIGSHSELGL